MKTYSVHAPPHDPDDAERFAFVKDGVSWPALFVPVLWLLWHRMWLTLVWYAVYVLALAWIGRLGGDGVATATAVLGNILFALEANNMRRASLASRGWREIGAAHGSGLEEAEIRFFHALARPEAASPSPPTPAAAQQTVVRPVYAPARSPFGEETVIGLFPEPER
jgi:hypothetical protein